MIADEKTLQSGAPSLNRLIYVCSISDYNLPEYESCLKRRPAYLVLLVSDYDRAQAAAERFANLVRSRIAGVQIIRPDQDGDTFGGADLVEFQQWLQRVLVPALARLPADCQRVYNLTGGTKMMALAVLTAGLGWSWLEYKAERGNSLQKVDYVNGILSARGAEELGQVDPVDVARLYSEHVKQERQNSIFSRSDSAAQAQKLWQGLCARDSSLLELFGDKKHGLESIWMYGAGNPEFKQKHLTVSACNFVANTTFNNAQLGWLHGWSRLKPDSLAVTPDSISLAGNKNSRDELRRWLSGDWLEQLASHWLSEEIPADRIRLNVRVRPENETNSSLGERETDILVYHKGATSIIEAKTDLPPGQQMSDAIRQLASISNRFGRVTKILLIGPQLLQRHQDKLEELCLRCNAEGILLAYCRASLLYAVLHRSQMERQD